mmetsp:Transcript_17257/g.20326  ORF Transcript_17257/g.20326 Transcript_17257/m.20326 type:complete len:295 (-) Transcript_17257:36-920(-)
MFSSISILGSCIPSLQQTHAYKNNVQHKPTTTFNLDDDLILHLVSFVDAETKLNFRLCCKEFNKTLLYCPIDLSSYYLKITKDTHDLLRSKSWLISDIGLFLDYSDLLENLNLILSLLKKLNVKLQNIAISENCIIEDIFDILSTQQSHNEIISISLIKMSDKKNNNKKLQTNDKSQKHLMSLKNQKNNVLITSDLMFLQKLTSINTLCLSPQIYPPYQEGKKEHIEKKNCKKNNHLKNSSYSSSLSLLNQNIIKLPIYGQFQDFNHLSIDKLQHIDIQNTKMHGQIDFFFKIY